MVARAFLKSADIGLDTPYFGQGLLRGTCAVIFLSAIFSEYILAYTDNSSGLLADDRTRRDDIMSSITFNATIRSRQVRQRPLSLVDRGSQH